MTKQLMDARRFLRYESANLLCGFRILASIILAIVPGHATWLAVLYSLAFVSYVLDDWCYRRYAQDQPYRHWFNKFLITLDPLANLIFVAGGFLHLLENNWSACWIFFILTVVAIDQKLIGNMAKEGSVLRKVAFTILAYYWFVVMMLCLFLVWLLNAGTYWVQGFGATVVIFYALYSILRDPKK